MPKSRLVLSKLLILKKIAVHLIRNEKFPTKAGGGTRLRQGYAEAGEVEIPRAAGSPDLEPALVAGGIW